MMARGGKRSGARSALPLLVGLTCLLAAAPVAADAVDPWVYAYAGLDHFYNLEYDDAIADLQKAVDGEPQNPIFYNFLANAYLFKELYRLGQLEGNLYDASNPFLREKQPQPDPVQVGKVKELVARVKKMCEARLAKNPNDVEALYALGTAYGIEGNYKFTIEKSWYQALSAGSKANELHEKVLKLNPSYSDAKLIPGVYQYVVGSIPRSVKWLAFLLGYHGSKERGIQYLQEAMLHGKYTTSDAAVLLSVIYNREQRFDYARQLLEHLADFYPRNPMLRLEIGRTYWRQGDRDQAIEIYLAVAHDMAAGKPGYDKVPRERLWYQIGMLYQQQARFAEALDAYGRVTERSDSDGLMKAYSGLRRGEIFAAQNRPELARAEYERVAALPYDEPRRQARERLRTLGN